VVVVGVVVAVVVELEELPQPAIATLTSAIVSIRSPVCRLVAACLDLKLLIVASSLVLALRSSCHAPRSSGRL
jgi:hypothetical protein